MAEHTLPRFCVSRLGSACWRASGRVECVRFTPDGKAVAAAVDEPWEEGDKDHGVVLYDRVSGERVGSLVGHERSVTHLDYSPDGNFLVSCGRGILIDEIATGKRTELLRRADDLVDSAVFSRDGALLASAHHEPYIVRVWDWPMALTYFDPLLLR